jgi:peptidoglycan/LPS O-acetylase OafA/YrhL
MAHQACEKQDLDAGAQSGIFASRFSPRRYYRPELDVVRLIAFLLIFAEHTLPSHADSRVADAIGRFAPVLYAASSACKFGLSLFFTLSAFLICELLLREREAVGEVGVKQFYIRRILRIWPLYYLALVLGEVAAFLPGGEHASALNMGWFAIFMGAWCLMTRGAFNNPAGVLWSISIEEQFYLFAPWIVKYFNRKSLHAFCLAIILVANIWLFCLGKIHTSYKPIWFNSFVQFECFACGILLCLLLRSRLPGIAVWQRMLLVSCGLFGWFSACYWLHNDFAYPGENPGSWPLIGGYALGALGAVLILVAFLGLDHKLIPGWAVYLGRISFGLYVYHLFALDIVNHVMIGHLASISSPIFILKAIMTLGLNILMAVISYHFFELPFLRMKKRHTIIESEPIGANVTLLRGARVSGATSQTM